MGPIRAVDSVLSKFFTLHGRAQRSEYWWWYAFSGLGVFAAIMVDIAMFDMRNPSLNPFSYLSVLFSLFTIPPGFTVTIRRLHDSGRSGWWYLIVLIPFGGIILLIFMLLPSDHNENMFGPPPGGMFRPRSGDNLPDPVAPRQPARKSNPYAVYARMEREEAMRGTPALAEARKAQVSDYYRQRVLGKS